MEAAEIVKQMTTSKVVLRGIKDLKPYERNARVHDERQITNIVKSIQRFGFVTPIIIDGDGGIIAGHGRHMAAEKMGLKKVPCIVMAHLTEDEKRAYILADNELALQSTWDDRLRYSELKALADRQFDLSALGVDDDDMERLRKMVEEGKQAQGARELDEEEFSEFDHMCPRCHFEFNDDGGEDD